MARPVGRLSPRPRLYTLANHQLEQRVRVNPLGRDMTPATAHLDAQGIDHLVFDPDMVGRKWMMLVFDG